MVALIDLTGQRFGRWEVIQKSGTTRFGAYWRCVCECSPSVVHTVRGLHLRSGRSQSCGCLRSEALRIQKTTHGLSKTRIYKIWEGIISRCTNPKAAGYADYGGRGIAFDPRWENFVSFLEDAGMPPSDRHTLDRREVDGGYSKDNCRWATSDEQASNRRSNVFIEHNGEKLTRTQWAKRIGIDPKSLQNRLNAGRSLDRALSEGKRGTSEQRHPSPTHQCSPS